MAKQTVYQFYCWLADYEPEMWRRFQVTENTTLAKLGYTVMSMYEMMASHLFAVQIPHVSGSPIVEGQPRRDIEPVPRLAAVMKKQASDAEKQWGEKDPYCQLWFQVPDPTGEAEDSLDAVKYKLKDVLHGIPGENLLVLYDFGDSWTVPLQVEKVIRDMEGTANSFPRVLDGKGRGIIEDSGGTDGLMELVEALKDPDSDEYEEYVEWLGVDKLDMDAFDVRDADIRVRKVPKIYKGIYEQMRTPTAAEVDFLERRYPRYGRP